MPVATADASQASKKLLRKQARESRKANKAKNSADADVPSADLDYEEEEDEDDLIVSAGQVESHGQNQRGRIRCATKGTKQAMPHARAQTAPLLLALT